MLAAEVIQSISDFEGLYGDTSGQFTKDSINKTKQN